MPTVKPPFCLKDVLNEVTFRDFFEYIAIIKPAFEVHTKASVYPSITSIET